MAKCNPSIIPINSGLPNTIMPGFPDYQFSYETIFWYSSAVRFLIYAITMTWLEITFALSIVSKYCNNPNSTYVAAITWILQYIKNTLHDCIIFCGNLDTKLNLIGYTDAYFGSTKKDRKFTSKWLFYLESVSISGNSKR